MVRDFFNLYPYSSHNLLLFVEEKSLKENNRQLLRVLYVHWYYFSSASVVGVSFIDTENKKLLNITIFQFLIIFPQNYPRNLRIKAQSNGKNKIPYTQMNFHRENLPIAFNFISPASCAFVKFMKKISVNFPLCSQLILHLRVWIEFLLIRKFEKISFMHVIIRYKIKKNVEGLAK